MCTLHIDTYTHPFTHIHAYMHTYLYRATDRRTDRQTGRFAYMHISYIIVMFTCMHIHTNTSSHSRIFLQIHPLSHWHINMGLCFCCPGMLEIKLCHQKSAKAPFLSPIVPMLPSLQCSTLGFPNISYIPCQGARFAESLHKEKGGRVKPWNLELGPCSSNLSGPFSRLHRSVRSWEFSSAWQKRVCRSCLFHLLLS